MENRYKWAISLSEGEDSNHKKRHRKGKVGGQRRETGEGAEPRDHWKDEKKPASRSGRGASTGGDP